MKGNKRSVGLFGLGAASVVVSDPAIHLARQFGDVCGTVIVSCEVFPGRWCHRIRSIHGDAWMLGNAIVGEIINLALRSLFRDSQLLDSGKSKVQTQPHN